MGGQKYFWAVENQSQTEILESSIRNRVDDAAEASTAALFLQYPGGKKLSNFR